ncbi:MAG TPA: hypothetical protein VEO54_22515 [Thermoanaerobaculia bacterium]|nr:hypothetical protein [Thermoanaerobaculia bacterium]
MAVVPFAPMDQFFFAASHCDAEAIDGSPGPPPQSIGQLVAVSPHDFTHWPSPQRPQRAVADDAKAAGTGAGAASFVDLQSAGQVRSFSHDGAQ